MEGLNNWLLQDIFSKESFFILMHLKTINIATQIPIVTKELQPIIKGFMVKLITTILDPTLSQYLCINKLQF